jgi:methyl-accepting chemotaxis protein
MKDVKVATKFIVILGIFGVFMLLTTTFVVGQMWNVDNSFRDLNSGPAQAALEVSRAGRLLVKAQMSIANVLLARNASESSAALKQLTHAHNTYVQELDKASTNDPANASAYATVKADGLAAMDTACGPTLAAARRAVGAAAEAEASAIYESQCGPSFTKVVDAITAKSLALTTDVNAKEATLSQTTMGVIGATFAIVVGGVIGAMVGGQFSIGAWIVKPMTALSSTMSRLANGDVQAIVEGAERGDELGVMARALQVFKDAGLDKQRLEAEAAAQRSMTEQERLKSEEMHARAAKEQADVVTAIGAGLEHLSAGDLTAQIMTTFAPEYEKLRDDFNAAVTRLQHTMQTVVGRTQALSAGAQEITQASDDLSKRTEQQAASLEETAAALDQITATVKKTAEGAVEARKVVAVAKEDAETSGAVVRDAVGAMTRIEQSSHEISQIIGVIDEIAFQTNLLALNAGVEAARAGDAGKGFAVVASEVRALAQRSAQAAKEIKGLISASTEQVSQGVELVGATGRALSRIAEQIAQINGVVSEIAASAQEQATGLNQVNAAVNQMDQVTQQNAAMVEQATAAAHSLREETNAVSELMARFRIGDGAPSPARPPATGKINSVHAVQRKVANFVGGGRAIGRASQPSLASTSGSWEEF